MNKRLDYYLTLLLVIMTLLVGLFTVETTSNITTGIGFGKDARFIVSTQNENHLDDFLLNETNNLKEIRKINISKDMYLLTMSGIEQVDDYQTKLENIDANLEVLVTGTFGSLTKLKNNESFIATYFLVFFLILGLYFLNRFKMIGYISALVTISLVMGSLYMTHRMNFPFTKALWYAILVSIVILIYHEQRYLRLFKGRQLGQVIASNDSVNKSYVQTQIIQAIFFVFIGLAAYNLTSFGFFSVGIYMLALGVLSIVKIFFRRFLLFPLFIYSAKIDNHLEMLEFQDKPLFNWQMEENKLHKYLSTAFLIFLLLVLAMGSMQGFTLKESEDYTNQNVMILSRSDANSYLQLQALLHEHDMIDKQRGYDVSEQEELWVKFSDKVPFDELENISKVVGKEMNVSVTYYNTGSALNPLMTPIFYSILAFFILLAWFMTWSLHTFTASTQVPFVAVTGTAFFVLFMSAFQVEWTREIVYVTWSLPIVLATIMSSESDLFYINQFKDAFLKTSSLNFVILMMMALPVFIIVPTSIAVEMVFILALMLISIHFALFVLDLLKRTVGRLMSYSE